MAEKKQQPSEEQQEDTRKKPPIVIGVPTLAAKEKPRRIFIKEDNVWVGIGGPVKVIRDGQEQEETPEATSEQYLKLINRLPLLVTQKIVKK